VGEEGLKDLAAVTKGKSQMTPMELKTFQIKYLLNIKLSF